jgi:signal peptide peptidase SppA
MFDRLKKLLPRRFRKTPSIVHVIRLEGPITTGRSLGATALNLDALEPLLKKAFVKNVAAVALAINCPGGSPVQSALIGQRIRALAAQHNLPVYAFCEDVAASGGYWLACAADEIYADENSIVGSIGVISMGFGFPRALDKLGVDRRVHTAGLSKSTNDPFVPEKPEDVAKLKVILEEMHESFMAMVLNRRAGKLTAPESLLFSGAFWTGITAEKHGLVDGIGHMHAVLQAKFGEKVEIKKISAPTGILRRFGLGSASLSHAASAGIGKIDDLPRATIDVLEERALWSRFGL